MDDIQIKIDVSDIKKRLEKLKGIKGGAAQAMMRALNRAASGMNTDAWSEAKGQYNFKQKKDFTNGLKVEKATPTKLSAALRSNGRPIRSFKFKHRKNRASGGKRASDYFGRSFRRAKRSRERGPDKRPRKAYSGGGWNRGFTPVFLHVKKSGSGRYVKEAFVATMPNGMTGFFQRTGELVEHVKARIGKQRTSANNSKGKENIRQLYSPGATQMLKDIKVNKIIQEKAVMRLNKELDHQIKFLLSQ